ncbi:MAG: OadG family protein [Treponema sp.]|jgi:sodium pump decarboxylase gamma subunit|nr:OadG family protein [Treponema sp.]
MTILKMLEQSAILILLGMAIVFAFLWIMILCITQVGRLVHSMGWDKNVPPPKPAAAAEGVQNTIPQEVIAAIMAGLTEYRKTGFPRE